MNKEQQIEEMYNDIVEIIDDHFDDSTIITASMMEDMYDKGYRKVGKNEVILTEEENSEYIKLKFDFENAKEVIDFLQTDNKRLSNSIVKCKEFVRKKTAKEILQGMLNNMHKLTGCGVPYHIKKFIEDFAKEYGVGVEE